MAEPLRDGTASGASCQGLPLRRMSLDSLPQPRCISSQEVKPRISPEGAQLKLTKQSAVRKASTEMCLLQEWGQQIKGQRMSQ